VLVVVISIAISIVGRVVSRLDRLELPSDTKAHVSSFGDLPVLSDFKIKSDNRMAVSRFLSVKVAVIVYKTIERIVHDYDTDRKFTADECSLPKFTA